MSKKEDQKIYKFVGAGLGVPGLPHQVTMAWAKEDGPFAVDQLEAAILNGNYKELKTGPKNITKKEGDK